MAERIEEIRNRLNTRLNTILKDLRVQFESQEVDNERLDYISLRLDKFAIKYDG